MSFFPSGFQTATRRRTRWGTRPYTLEFYRGWDAISSLEKDWIRLTRIHPDPVPSVSWEAVTALRRVGLSRGTPVAVAIRMEDRIEAILPLTSRNWVGGIHLRFLGGVLLHRHEPLLTPEVRMVSAGLLLKRVARKFGRSVLFDLTGLRPNGFGADWLREGLATVPGWYFSKGARETTVPLESGWDSVRVAIPRSLRVAAEQGRERARRSGGLEVSFTGEPTSQELAEIFELAGRQGSFLATRPGRVLKILVTESALQGRIHLSRLRLKRELAAGTVCWILGGEVVELFSVENHEMADLSPSAVMRCELLEHLAEDERVRKLWLPPGHPDEVSDLSPIPQSQDRIWGAPLPGVARIAAQAGDWYSRHRNLCELPMRMLGGWFRPRETVEVEPASDPSTAGKTPTSERTPAGTQSADSCGESQAALRRR